MGKAFKSLEPNSKSKYLISWRIFISFIVQENVDSTLNLQNLLLTNFAPGSTKLGSSFLSMILKKSNGTIQTADYISHVCVHLKYLIRLVVYKEIVDGNYDVINYVKTNKDSIFSYFHRIRNLTQNQISIPKARCSFPDLTLQCVIVDGTLVSLHQLKKIYAKGIEKLDELLKSCSFRTNFEQDLQKYYSEDYRNTEKNFTGLKLNLEETLTSLSNSEIGLI